ncbi:MAG: SDR family NAD(P)-dependent oxidoreductase [Ilumatobacteraceae bacterium]
MSTTHLAGKVAVVTGAGGGIGREHALALAAAGARVVVNDLGVDLHGQGGTSGPADAVAAEIVAAGGEAVANADSVSDADSAARIVAAAVDAWGRLDVLVNNASVFRDGPFSMMTTEDFAADVAVHLFGTFHMCKAALAVMATQGTGRIVNTTSSAWYTGVGYAAYAAVKGGIASMTYDLAEEFRHLGITVNAIAPGAMTEHRAVNGKVWLEKVSAVGISLVDGPPAPAALGAEYVPPMVVFLASDHAGAVTGKIFETIAGSVGVYARPDVVARVFKDPSLGPWTQDELRTALPVTILPELAP